MFLKPNSTANDLEQDKCSESSTSPRQRLSIVREHKQDKQTDTHAQRRDRTLYRAVLAGGRLIMK